MVLVNFLRAYSFEMRINYESNVIIGFYSFANNRFKAIGSCCWSFFVGLELRRMMNFCLNLDVCCRSKQTKYSNYSFIIFELNFNWVFNLKRARAFSCVCLHENDHRLCFFSLFSVENVCLWWKYLENTSIVRARAQVISNNRIFYQRQNTI